jgi:hypothetical protein
MFSKLTPFSSQTYSHSTMTNGTFYFPLITKVGSPALLTNIRLGWKGLPGTNTLAYYKHL